MDNSKLYKGFLGLLRVDLRMFVQVQAILT